jgi:hypothetical protein
MWNAVNRKTSELISVDMVLIDEKVRFEIYNIILNASTLPY